MIESRKIFVFGMFLILTLFLSGSSEALDFSPGFRVGAYFDAESAFVGGEVVMGFMEDWSLVPNVEYVFVDNADMVTFNFDFQYNIRTSYPVQMWAGAGPAIIYFDPDRPDGFDDTDFGVNLFFGVGFPLHEARFMPYVQPKLILSDDTEFSLAFGIRF
jgi:hypothetical protein